MPCLFNDVQIYILKNFKEYPFSGIDKCHPENSFEK